MTDPNKKEGFSQAHKGLYEGLNEQGLYTKSYEEFSMQFSTPESQKALFDAVSGQGLYTKSPDEFYSQFFNVKKKDKADLPPVQFGARTAQPILAPDSEGASTGSTSDTSQGQQEPSGDSGSATVEPSYLTYAGASPTPAFDVTIEGAETQYLDGAFGDMVNSIPILGDVFDDAARAWGQGQATGDIVPFSFSMAIGDITPTEETIQSLVNQVNDYDARMREVGVSDEAESFAATQELNGGGVWGFLVASAEHPQGLLETLVSSTSGMMNRESAENALAMVSAGTAAGATAGLAGGPLAPVTSGAGAVAGFGLSLTPALGMAGATVEMGMSFVDFLKEELGDKEFTYENVAPILMDESKLRQIRKRSALRAGTIGFVDSFGGAVLSRSAKAAKAAGKAQTRVVTQTAAGEATTGVTGELLAQTASGQTVDIGEALMEGSVGVVGTPVTLASAAIQDRGSYKVNGGAVSKKQASELVEDLSDDEISQVNIEVDNDPELQAEIEKKKRKSVISKDIPDEYSEQDRAMLVDLELERQELEGKGTQTAKRRLAKIDEQIENINARYDGDVDVAETEAPAVADQLGRIVVLEDGTRGELRRDTEYGDRVVVETEDRIIDLGNAEEVMDKPISELNISEDKSNIEVTPDGTILYEGNEFGIQRDLPERGIEYDEEGNVTRVSLKDAEGKTIMLEGQDAQDAAYQILLDEAQTPEQEQKINDLLEQDEEFQREHDEYVRRKEAELSGEPAEAAPVAEEPAAEVSEEAPSAEPVSEPAPAQGPQVNPEEYARKLEEEGVYVKGKGIRSKLDGLRRRFFSARSFMPKSMFAAREKREANISKQTNIAQQNIREFNRLLKGYKGDQNQLLADFDDALRGGEGLNRLPDEFAGLALEMRNQIDRLSIDLINLGVVPDSQVDKVIGNLGQYLTRSFEVFTNKDWKNKVSEEVKNEARNFLREQNRAMAMTDYLNPELNPEGLDAEAFLEKRVEGLMNKYLDPNEAAAFASAASDTKNTNILKQRKDIPKEILALMGEYTDPAQNYASSILKMAQTAEGARFLNTVKESGKGVWLFDKPTGPNSVQIASEGSEAMAPLNGMYTTPEIAAEFNKVPEQMGSFMKKYMAAIGTVKWAKTIGSIGTHSKNVIGNLGFMWANGHYDLTQLETAYQTLKADMKGGSQALQDRMNRYIELGIVKQSAALGEIRDMFKDANMDDALANRMNNENLSRSQNLLRKARVGMKKAENLYQAEDDFFKIVAFENERNRYAKAQFGVEADQLTPEQSAELDNYVAELVKNTYPTYSRVPEAIQMIRRFPFMGNFVSFQAESYRVAWNTMAQGISEIKSDNPEIRKIGAQRLAGASSYAASKAAVTGMFGKAVGAGVMGVVGRAMDDEGEDQRQEDLRKFMAPWSQNSRVIPYAMEDGKFSYIDISASDPYGHFDKIANSFMRGEDSIESFGKGLFTVIEPFLGEEILTRRFINLSRNVNDYGKPIYNPESPQTQQMQDVMAYMYEVIEPGTFTSVRKIYNSGGSPEEVGGQLTGFKPYEVDVNQQLGFKMVEFKEKLYDANSLKYKNFDQARDAYRAAQEEMHEFAMSANRLGVSKKAIIETIQKYTRVSKKQAEGIFIGRYKPITPPKPERPTR